MADMKEYQSLTYWESIEKNTDSIERLEYLTESQGKLIASLKERVKSLERLISALKGVLDGRA